MREQVIGLRRAVPYLRLFKGATFVIKVGGDVLADAGLRAAFSLQVALLHQVGIDLVLVHGGGPQASALSAKLGVPVEQVNGRRITCADTLEVAKMAFNGTLNTDLLAALRKEGVNAVGLSGVDAGLITATRRPPTTVTDTDSGKTREVDFGYVGDVESVDPSVLRHLLAGGFVPVVSALAGGDDGQIFNVNADTIAMRLAVALKAMKLLLLTSAPGVLADPDDPGSLISRLDAAALERAIAESARGGMMAKLEACRQALAAGVPRTHILSGLDPNALLEELFTNEGSGTLIESEHRPEPA